MIDTIKKGIQFVVGVLGLIAAFIGIALIGIFVMMLAALPYILIIVVAAFAIKWLVL